MDTPLSARHRSTSGPLCAVYFPILRHQLTDDPSGWFKHLCVFGILFGFRRRFLILSRIPNRWCGFLDADMLRPPGWFKLLCAVVISGGWSWVFQTIPPGIRPDGRDCWTWVSRLVLGHHYATSTNPSHPPQTFANHTKNASEIPNINKHK